MSFIGDIFGAFGAREKLEDLIKVFINKQSELTKEKKC